RTPLLPRTAFAPAGPPCRRESAVPQTPELHHLASARLCVAHLTMARRWAGTRQRPARGIQPPRQRRSQRHGACGDAVTAHLFDRHAVFLASTLVGTTEIWPLDSVGFEETLVGAAGSSTLRLIASSVIFTICFLL